MQYNRFFDGVGVGQQPKNQWSAFERGGRNGKRERERERERESERERERQIEVETYSERERETEEEEERWYAA